MKGFKENLARKPQGNDRAQVKAVKEGVCDLAIGNSYYYGAMLKKEDQKAWAESVYINLLPCEVINKRQVFTPIGLIESYTDIYAQPGQTAEIFIRPGMFILRPCQCEDQSHSARVSHQQFMGQSLRT